MNGGGQPSEGPPVRVCVSIWFFVLLVSEFSDKFDPFSWIRSDNQEIFELQKQSDRSCIYMMKLHMYEHMRRTPREESERGTKWGIKNLGHCLGFGIIQTGGVLTQILLC